MPVDDAIMRNMRRRLPMRGAAMAGAGCLALLAMGGLPAASAEDRTGIGDLICTLGDSTTEPTPGLEGMAPREMICLFRYDETGTEETYRGKLQMVGDLGDLKEKTLLWVVSVRSDVKATAGFLSQTYSSDTETSPDNVAPMVVGDAQNGIGLKLMIERKKGAPPVRVGSVELTLSTTGT